MFVYQKNENFVQIIIWVNTKYRKISFYIFAPDFSIAVLLEGKNEYCHPIEFYFYF